MSDEDIVVALRKRAEIRRKITARGPDDRLANQLEKAAAEIETLRFRLSNALVDNHALLAKLEAIHEGLTSDLEHGVRWMNEEANARFASDYKYLLEAINKSREA